MKNKSVITSLVLACAMTALTTACSVETKSNNKKPANDPEPTAVNKLAGLDGQWSSQCFNSVLGNQVRTLNVTGEQMMISIDKYQDEHCTVPLLGSEENLSGTFEQIADLESGGVIVELNIPLDGNISTSREFSLAKTDYGFSMSLFYNTAFDDPRPMILEMRPPQSGDPVPAPEEPEPAMILSNGAYDRLERVEQGCDHEITATYDGRDLISISIVKDSGCSPKYVTLECEDDVCRSSQGDVLQVTSEKSYRFRAFYGFPSNYELKE